MHFVYMEYPLITVLIQNPYVLQMTPGYSATVTLTNTGLAETNRCEISKAVYTNMLLDIAKSYHPLKFKMKLAYTAITTNIKKWCKV